MSMGVTLATDQPSCSCCRLTCGHSEDPLLPLRLMTMLCSHSSLLDSPQLDILDLGSLLTLLSDCNYEDPDWDLQELKLDLQTSDKEIACI